MVLKRRSEQRAPAADYEKLENDEYEGRLIYVADLGLQHREYKGEVKTPCQQISLGIEILGQPVNIDGEAKPRVLWTQPFNVFHELTSKGKELVFYSIFNTSAAEGEVADWDAVLGSPCNVVVGKRSSADGTKEFDTINTLTTIPRKYQDDVAKGELEPCVGDADDDANPCTLALFGLAKFVFEKRLEETDAY